MKAKSARSPNGSGYFFHDGRNWHLRYYVRDRRTGKLVRRNLSGNTKRELQARMLEDKILSGQFSAPSVSLGEWLEYWIFNHAGHLRTTTVENYRLVIQKHVIPALGSLPMNMISPEKIAGFIGKLLESHAPNTIRRIRTVLTAAWKQAIIDGKTYRNPVDAVPAPPKARKMEVSIFGKRDLMRFLEEARSSRYWLGFLLLCSTGMRLGEALALKWSAVSEDCSSITIRETISQTSTGLEFCEPKTAGSMRTVYLPQTVTNELSSIPRRFRTGYVTKGKWSGFCHPQTFRREYERLLEKARLPRVTIHGLRHTHASILLKEGVSIHDVSRRLGHVSIATTSDIYGHLVPGETDTAAAKLDGLMNGKEPDPEKVIRPTSPRRCAKCGFMWVDEGGKQASCPDCERSAGILFKEGDSGVTGTAM